MRSTLMRCWRIGVSVLFNEPKLLKHHTYSYIIVPQLVSVLFNEPKLLKFFAARTVLE